ncbi:hypothetical protein DV736_g1220, partial [Chaetothyriales sp. CBS 134916]
MSRGGRGGGSGRQKNQPDFSWDDEEQAPAAPNAHRPPPTFPRLDLPVPRPLDAWEGASVKAYLSFRTRCHNSPFYSTLDPSTQTDDKGKVDKRAGVDPFNDQDVYSKRFERRKRTEPDLSGRRDGYSLQFFPKELWPLLDPKHKHPLANQKRGLDAEDDYPEDQNDDEEGGEDDDEPQDSEYDEDDEDMNDYNAEQIMISQVYISF